VIERTYDPLGSPRINLEECLVGPSRSAHLYSRSGILPADRSTRACTFLRHHDNSLYVAIYYAPDLIDTLERENPRDCLNHRNITSLITFIEEITHALHAIWAFRSGFREFGSEAFACTLEAQAKVDTYWLLLRWVGLLTDQAPDSKTKEWILSRLMEDERFDYQSSALAKRYRKASILSRAFIQALELLPASERVVHIRNFRSLSLTGKSRLVRQLGVRTPSIHSCS